MDECAEMDPQGGELVLGAEEMEDNEDDFIRLMHSYFINGHDSKWVDYETIDNDAGLDDIKQME